MYDSMLHAICTSDSPKRPSAPNGNEQKIMAMYKDPAFHERAGRSAAAKQKALDILRAKPAVDPAVLAERNAARLAREAEQAEARAAAKAAVEAAKAEAAALAAEERARIEAAKARPVPTEAERKAARDARYAARKNRK